jgi:UDP-N-acetylmuramate--alanine ligase
MIVLHRLTPKIAVVTAVDPDHLEIYGDHRSMIEGYNEFFRKIRQGGVLIYKISIEKELTLPGGVRCISYGANSKADYNYLTSET